MIQACVKFGTVEQRQKLFEQFKGKFSCHATDRCICVKLLSSLTSYSRMTPLWPESVCLAEVIIIIITLIVKSSKGFSSTIYNNICIPKNNKNIEKFKNLKLRESLP